MIPLAGDLRPVIFRHGSTVDIRLFAESDQDSISPAPFSSWETVGERRSRA